MKRIYCTLLIVALCGLTCWGQQKKRGFQLPEVPVMLDTPEARATFVCEHFWNHFDFSDTAYIHLPDITEQAIVDFMDLMPRVTEALGDRSMQILWQKAAPHWPMLWHFWETMSRYWKDANSPVRNEEMFIRLCRSVESVPAVEEGLKQRATFARTLAEKNRVGQPAIDFTYTLASGKQGRMYGLKADYTLLFFYNPDCETCVETKNVMRNSLRLKDMVSSGRMKVLTVYPDEDVALWRRHLGEMSEEWINGYDKGQILAHETLYDLSSIPSFYLLDKDKKVLLKDADWRQVMQFFEK